MTFFRACALISLLLCSAVVNANSIAVTIKPVHSIVAAVTEDVLEPSLLLSGAVSPHLDRVRPSLLRTMRKADLVIWVGPGLESFLSNAIQQLPETVQVIELSNTDLPVALPFRGRHARGQGFGDKDLSQSPNQADSNSHTQTQGHQQGGRHGENMDVHLWLAPENAIAIARLLAATLSERDPYNAERYQANAAAFIEDLSATVAQISAMLTESRQGRYLVFHDALQYFEHTFDINNEGVVTYQPQIAASARRLRELQKVVVDQSVSCILTEPQFESRTIRSLVNNTSVSYATIDPLASTYAPSAALYKDWLFDTARAIVECLISGKVSEK